jgi:glycine/D-amino acid oxidase-like deaminating enzyme/nitrite reductase/ring-hydroxylating ferredoxin subunit
MKNLHPSIGTFKYDGKVTSGENRSYWLDSVEPIKFSPLTENQSTDVVIVGGGIAGLSVAYCLLKKGKRVIVLEDGFVGSGESGRTTAHITNALDDRYAQIERVLGEEKGRLAAESHTKAIDFIEQTVHDEKIDCDFMRVDGFLFLHPTDEAKTIDEEFVVSNLYGIRTEKLNGVPGIPSQTGLCLRFPAQGEFHPMKYLKGLAQCIVRMGGSVYTETHVDTINKTEVKAGALVVRAAHVVVATNSPVNDLVSMHTKQHPYRTYVIGGLIPKNCLRPGLWWDTGNLKSRWVTDPYHYVRWQRFDDTHDLLIAGGEDHKTGQGDEDEPQDGTRFSKLEEWTRKRFPSVTEIVYQWSGQVLEPVDLMAFIGRNPGDKNIFIATGDSGNGMTHGTIAGMLISDLILGRTNPWEKLYDPSRITLRAGKYFIQEGGNMAAQYLDYFDKGDVKTVADLRKGQGAIVNIKGKKVAVYKDEYDTLHAYSAVCPHLGCILQWNDDEKSFDCPCHGSRFTCQGDVVNGPAISGMKKLEIGH